MFEGLHIGFIGGGNMGEALVKGILAASLFPADHVHVFDVSPARLEHLQSTYQVRVHTSTAEIAALSRILVLAVKPQTMSAVLEELRSQVGHAPLLISIAAGIPLSLLSAGLPPGTPLIRVMPNTPALVLRGASALSRSQNVTEAQMHMALTLFGAVGKAIEVEEKWMDTVTGLSGSGPAYVLLFVESLVDGGVLMGLPRPIARELVLETVAGTIEMMQATGKHPADLKDMITSPAGTTIRGLQVLEDGAVRGALMGAVEAAAQRSRELGKS